MARVGQAVLTLDELESERSQRGPSIGTQQIVDEWIRFQATLAQAQSAGYEQDPQLRAQWERFVVGRFQEVALAELRQAASPVSAEELQAYYEQHALEFTIPEAVRVSVLFLRSVRQATSEKRQALADEAEALWRQAGNLDGEGFRELIRERSDDQSTRYRGGDSGWLSRASGGAHWDRPVVEAALQLRRPGELGPLVETGQGFYILRLEEHRPQVLLPFAEVRERVTYQVAQQRQLEQQLQFTRKMRDGLEIQVNQQLIDTLSPPAVAVKHPIPPLPGG